MPFLKILRFFLLFLPFSLFGQSVQENLESINAQLAQFNNFQTSFELDQVAKTIICRDKFGTYSAFLKDIVLEKDDSGKNIEIYCLDESKCISSLKKDGSPGSSFSSYSIGLSQNADTVSSIGRKKEP